MEESQGSKHDKVTLAGRRIVSGGDLPLPKAPQLLGVEYEARWFEYPV